LTSEEHAPLVVLANESDGAWVEELVPSDPPALPIQFWNVRAGAFGPVLAPAGLVLFRWDLVAALRALSVANFDVYAATIRPPQAPGEIEDYGVVKIRDTRPIAALDTRTEYSILSVVAESPGTAVVSHNLRQSLERSGVVGLAFREPLFAAA
jgi:hypothetical protein